MAPAGKPGCGQYDVTAFRLAAADEEARVFWAVWTRENESWKIVSYLVLTP